MLIGYVLINSVLKIEEINKSSCLMSEGQRDHRARKQFNFFTRISEMIEIIICINMYIAGKVGEKGGNKCFAIRPGKEKEQNMLPQTPGCLIFPENASDLEANVVFQQALHLNKNIKCSIQ